MKKISAQQTKKAVAPKRLPSSLLKPEDNQDMKKKAKPPEPTAKTSTRTNVKKVAPQPSQLTISRTEKKDKIDATKPRTQTSSRANLAQSKKQIQVSSSTKTASGFKKPPAGNFNVTVFSPPSARKAASESVKEKTNASTTRDRTRTRTLKPEEITVLKNIPQISDEVSKETAKPPVSFDIQFENNKRTSTSSAKKQVANNVVEAENDDDQYESEFESYESDFETGSSKKSTSSSESSKKSCSLISSSSTDTDVSSSSDEEHGKARSRNEQKLDSGNYDMKLKRLLTVNDNSNTFGNLPKHEDNQPDSGMNSGLFETQPAPSSSKLLHKRYADILDKMSFNTMAFELYEDQPAPYEYFVKNYGKLKGVQSQTQTEKDANSNETQTDNIYSKSCWVQHPPQFSMSCLNNMNTDPNRYSAEKLGVGQENFHDEVSTSHQYDIFSDFLVYLEPRTKQTIQKTSNKLSFNLDDLCKFLSKSLHMVENELIRNISNCDKFNSKTVQLKLQNLSDNSTVTAAHFDVNSHHVLLTLHECNVEKSHHRFVVSVWDTRNCVRPKAVLSCWSTVVCTERIGPIVVAGTADGTLCLWNIKDSNEETAPFQLVSPMLTNDIQNCHCGSVVAVRATNQANGCSNLTSHQVLTLFEAGVLVTWSISRVHQEPNTDNDPNLNTTFHNAKFRLVQQNILKLFSMQKRLAGSLNRLSVPNNFQKGSLEDLLNSKNCATDEYTKDELSLNIDMLICHSKAIILLNRQIIIVNYLEQKCSLILKNQDLITNFGEHPIAKGCMFMLSSENTVKIMRISKNANTTVTQDDATVHNTKQHSFHSSSKLSPVLNNKSCAIQNIVKNERKLYHEASSHTDGFGRPLSSNLDNYSFNNSQIEQRKPEPVPFYHNQLFFIKQLNQRNSWLHFLDRGRILCVGTESNAKFIDLKTGQQTYLSDYIATDSNNHRLLGTTDKQVIITTDGQEIFLHDISGSFKRS